MPRKKLKDQDAILSHNLVIRVSEKLFKKLEKIYGESDCQSIAEVARKILSNQKINCFYRDVSLHAPMEEMALIQKNGLIYSIIDTKGQQIGISIKASSIYNKPIPVIARVTDQDIEENYKKIKQDIEELFTSELKKIDDRKPKEEEKPSETTGNSKKDEPEEENPNKGMARSM
ncbi:hypothetical protein [Pedobacter hiemivivus]|uniref:Uncharacterized protein n=1 Tax=Pedobacter hiemivivus TaxID=2530454 RepID=A0A4R0M9H8_9SPHI|nr:hypothetical protein [Pedobacter hiemivivus]TCC82825.1 hypothetical protein EZ444_26375 [Pedobacter hiemivivus]